MSHADPANGAHVPVADTPEHRAGLLAGPQRLALLTGVGGLIAFAVLAGLYATTAPAPASEDDTGPVRQVFLSYLTGFVFWTLIGLGSVFFLCVQYVTGGRWGILLRRPLEANAKLLPTLGAVLFIPIAVNMFMGENSIFWWARHAAHVHHENRELVTDRDQKVDNKKPFLDVDEEAKIADYLNPGFSVARGFAYFGILGLLVLWMWRNARAAEYDDNPAAAAAARDRQKYVGSVGLFVFALCTTWMATDWLMSLERVFSSSMFPVIVFDDAAVAAYAVGLLTLLYLKRKGEPRFQHLFPPTEQIHLGSLLLAFTLAWAYFSFSQYMLIWIGNLPEEIPFYLKRTRGGWEWYIRAAVIVHFPIPFLLLLFRRVKSNPVALRNICLMLLLVVSADALWWVAPALSHAGAPKFYLLLDLAAWVGVGGIWVGAFLWLLQKHPLLPTREVDLLEAYHHGH